MLGTDVASKLDGAVSGTGGALDTNKGKPYETRNFEGYIAASLFVLSSLSSWLNTSLVLSQKTRALLENG